MFGKKKNNPEEKVQQSSGALRQSRFAKELNLPIGNIDFGLNRPPAAEDFQANYSPTENPSDVSANANFEHWPEEIAPQAPAHNYQEHGALGSLDTPVLDDQMAANHFAPPETDFYSDEPTTEWDNTPVSTPSFQEPLTSDNVEHREPKPSEAPQQDFQFDSYAQPLSNPEEFSDFTPHHTSEQSSNFASEFTQEFSEEESFQHQSFTEAVSIDEGTHYSSEIPPVELNPSPTNDFYSEPVHTEKSVMPESSAGFLDNVNDEFYPKESVNEAEHFGDFSDTSITEAEEAFEEAGNFLFPEADLPRELSTSEEIEPLSQPSSVNTSFPSPPKVKEESTPRDSFSDWDNSSTHTMDDNVDLTPPNIETELQNTEFKTQDLSFQEGGFGSFDDLSTPVTSENAWGEPNVEKSSHINNEAHDESGNEVSSDPLSTPVSDPLSGGFNQSIEDIQPIDFDPLSASDPLAVNAVSLDPFANEQANTISLDPTEQKPITMNNPVHEVPEQETTDVQANPLAEMNPEDLHVIATHPLIDDKSLILIEGNGQVALMGQAGNDEDAMVAIIKMFGYNPIASNQTFTAVKEASAGAKHMFLTQVGDWQGIVSCDDRIVALHTELS